MIDDNGIRRLRKVLAIPLDELYKHFETNTRQDIKIIIPEMLTGKLYNMLLDKSEDIKPEQTLEERYWVHSPQDEPNRVCESSNFIDPGLPQYAQGPFALSFANEKAPQDVHYHTRHWEIYCSEKPLNATFRYFEEAKCRSISLPQGGAMIFGPGVVHRIELAGMTMVIEVPSVSADKESAELELACEEHE
ncbi:MAG: hypothetical protein JW934_07420 [Anaerolineae bacterium]|nr:hypothetical protein [Anaerolineae bacterium]